MAEYVEIRARAKLGAGNDKISQQQAESAVGQALKDAVEGSYAPFPAKFFGRLSLAARRGSVRQLDDWWELEFGLPAQMFPPRFGGLQHLVGVLASDPFSGGIGGVAWERFEIVSLVLPQSMRDECNVEFGQYSNRISDVRSAFSLKDHWPLLAFTFKPRVGVDQANFERVSIDILKNGFNLVEPDTRCVSTALANGEIEGDWLVRLGQLAGQARPGETAFAPNLTMPSDLSVEVAEKWRRTTSNGPFIVKIDGGLDGLSSIQAVRRRLKEQGPIITCYPLLRQGLSGRIPKDVWVDLLSLSGADVIYPGGRPSFPEERRPIWPIEAGSFLNSAYRYDEFLNSGRPMPTYAGGAHAAHLHAAYELLGPDTALFLGGAVALHKDGPTAGAILCRDILDAAITAVQRDWEKDFSDPITNRRLISRVEECYALANTSYTAPNHIFKPTEQVVDPVKPRRHRIP